MPIANYTTKVPAGRSLEEVQKMLIDHGAVGILTNYEQGTGRIDSVMFKIDVGDKQMGFKLPIKWKEARQVMVSQGVRRAETDVDYCYRVAWRILRDWVRAQMALIEIGMVKLDEIFFPYIVQKSGKTLYEASIGNPERLIGGAN